MDRLLYEFTESIRIAFAQIRANKMRSALTALGVIIGIVAVTLMGTAIHGIDIGFDRSLAVLGDDILYVEKWPWHGVEDWWNYVNRPPFHAEDAEALNKIFAGTPGSLLDVAVPEGQRASTMKSDQNQVSGVFTIGTNADYGRTVSIDFQDGRLFNETEARTGTQVCVVGSEVADKLYPGRSPLGQSVKIDTHPFRIIGVLAKQGSFLGLFSLDNQTIIPINAYRKFFDVHNGQVKLVVKVKDKLHLIDAQEELIGAMRRVRGLLPGGENDNFSVEQQQAFKEQLDPIKQGIAFAGLFVTGLSLFVGAIGIMNITFVSVRERTKEIGTRKALGARRRTILMQFLIEAVSICVVGGFAGLGLTYVLSLAVKSAMPSFPLEFSFSLVFISLLVSVATGIVSGFVPALGASPVLDPSSPCAMNEVLKMAFSSLGVNKLRSFLTMSGITIGVFSVIGVMTAVSALRGGIEHGLSFLGSNIFQFGKYPVGISVDGNDRHKYESRRNITYAQARRYTELMRGSADVVCLKVIENNNTVQATYGGRKTTPDLNFLGTNEYFLDSNQFSIGSGRNFTGADIDLIRPVAIIGQDIVTKLFPSENPLGKSIKANGHTYEVVGVFAVKGKSFGESQDNFLIIPITRFLMEFGADNYTVNIATQAPSQLVYNETMDKGIGALRIARGLRPDQENDFELYSNDSLIAAFAKIADVISGGAFIISAIALLAAGVGIMNIMLVSVTERTREIGVRKAVGARKILILTQFLVESVILSITGGLAGIFLGTIAGDLLAMFLKFSTVFPWGWAAAGVIVCSFIGIVFGMYPAWKAASLDPIEALRFE